MHISALASCAVVLAVVVVSSTLPVEGLTSSPFPSQDEDLHHHHGFDSPSLAHSGNTGLTHPSFGSSASSPRNGNHGHMGNTNPRDYASRQRIAQVSTSKAHQSWHTPATPSSFGRFGPAPSKSSHRQLSHPMSKVASSRHFDPEDDIPSSLFSSHNDEDEIFGGRRGGSMPPISVGKPKLTSAGRGAGMAPSSLGLNDFDAEEGDIDLMPTKKHGLVGGKSGVASRSAGKHDFAGLHGGFDDDFAPLGAGRQGSIRKESSSLDETDDDMLGGDFLPTGKSKSGSPKSDLKGVLSGLDKNRKKSPLLDDDVEGDDKSDDLDAFDDLLPFNATTTNSSSSVTPSSTNAAGNLSGLSLTSAIFVIVWAFLLL